MLECNYSDDSHSADANHFLNKLHPAVSPPVVAHAEKSVASTQPERRLLFTLTSPQLLQVCYIFTGRFASQRASSWLEDSEYHRGATSSDEPALCSDDPISEPRAFASLAMFAWRHVSAPPLCEGLHRAGLGGDHASNFGTLEQMRRRVCSITIT